MSLRDFFRGKSLRDHIFKEKVVRVKGIRFSIRKIDVMDHLEGLKVALKMYQTYEEKRSGKSFDESNMKKFRVHMKDVILASVIYPKLSRKEGEKDLMWIEDLFIDFDLAGELYGEILAYTYGKKKVKALHRELLLDQRSLNLT